MAYNLSNLVLDHLKGLSPYSSARDEFSERAEIYLDANENPFSPYGRYPDPSHLELRKSLSALRKVSTENILIGNGSDELIDLLLRLVVRPGRDKVLYFTPTYGMYRVSAEIAGAKTLEMPLSVDFNLPLGPTLERILKDPDLKVVFLCSPNNPTGNTLPKEEVRQILSSTSALVVVDEAYADFAKESSLDLLETYGNLVVLQTFSKAFGLAAARLGMAYASEELIAYLRRIKPPYNVSTFSQSLALERLKSYETVTEQIQKIIKERQRLEKALAKLPSVLHVYPSEANFLLVEFSESKEVFQYLLSCSIVVRDRSKEVPGALRITVGTPKENNQLLSALKKYNA